MIHATGEKAVDRELSFEEYLRTPETKLRHEVIDGVILMSPSPTAEHQWLQGNLYRPLFAYAAQNGLGSIILAPSDLLIRKLPKLRVRQPDLMYFPRCRLSREDIRTIHVFEVAPDLAVEIVSPSDSPARWADKLADYASIGVAELWRVDPGQGTVEVLSLAEGRYVLASRFGGDDDVRSGVLPGLALPVRSIFE
jgi:Uma2 family endonuclease